jgi:hypothetical protein
MPSRKRRSLRTAARSVRVNFRTLWNGQKVEQELLIRCLTGAAGMNIRALFTLAVFLCAPNVKAEDAESSAKFIGRCRNGLNNTSEIADFMFCAGFVTGATNGALIMGGAPFCVKSPLTTEQMMRIYLKWADQNPEQWQMPPAATVLRAFVVYFPCKQ